MDFQIKKTGLVIALVAAIGYFILSQVVGILIWDEAAYLGNALEHVGTSYFTEDFRFPLLEWIIALFWLVTGESIVVARLLMSLITGLFVFTTYLLSGIIMPKKWQVLATILIAINMYTVVWSYRIYTDIPSVTAALFGLWFFYQYVQSKKNYFLWLVGLLFTASFLFRFSLILYALPIGVLLLWKKEWKAVVRVLGGAAILLVPWMAYNSIQYGNPLWDVFAQGAVIAQYTTWQPISQFLQPFLQGFFPLIIGLIGAVHYLKKQKGPLLVSTSILLLHLVLHLGFVGLKLSRYFLTVSAIIIILSIYGFWRMETYLKRRHFFAAIAVVLIVTSATVTIGEIQKLSYSKACNDAVENTNAYLSQYPEGTLIVSNYWPIFAIENNLHSRFLWTTDIEELLIGLDAQKVLLVNPGGIVVNQTQIQQDPSLELEKQFIGSCEGYNVTIYDINV